MSPSLLVVGATGNTGRGVVETLSNSIHRHTAGYRILALTRSSKSATAQQLSRLPNVTIVETNWTEITADWLREQNVVRAFIASHNNPNQFAEESTFHLAALRAGVKYVVRISTTAANVRPDCDAYYPRAHWAIENMLQSPAFEELQWTSLQPNVFAAFWMGPAAELIKSVRSGKKQDTLRLMANPDTPVGIIDAYEVGILAAHLLLQEDVSKHSKARYTLNGPEDITGNEIVKMVEDHIGVKVEDVSFKDLSFLEYMVQAAPQESRNVIMSIRHAPEIAWAGLCKAETTSKEVLDLAAPRNTPADALVALLQ
ncbi:hypothetical protein B5807_11378 [Epicoccum nigrum]|uniref:NmrA-like domain-containing protein n=1 Tax=Epicoccum nigrum TaxID=105696 RepID=A0A1Y2LJL4_EPING|nr:hypothetical protein B5807_11378 [Epicoccum nigrum]